MKEQGQKKQEGLNNETGQGNRDGERSLSPLRQHLKGFPTSHTSGQAENRIGASEKPPDQGGLGEGIQYEIQTRNPQIWCSPCQVFQESIASSLCVQILPQSRVEASV